MTNKMLVKQILKHISKAELASRMDVSTVCVSQWLAGKRKRDNMVTNKVLKGILGRVKR